jgi:hypothetical protein
MRASSKGAIALAIASPLLLSGTGALAQTGLYIAPNTGFFGVSGGISQSTAKAPGFGKVTTTPSQHSTEAIGLTPPGSSYGSGAGAAAQSDDGSVRFMSRTSGAGFDPIGPNLGSSSSASAGVPPYNRAVAMSVVRSNTGNIITDALAESNARRTTTSWGGDNSLSYPLAWFAGLQLSRGLAEPVLGAFNIVQFDLSLNGASGRRGSYAMTARTVDGLGAFSYADTQSGHIGDDLKSLSGEATVKFKALQQVGGVVTGYTVEAFGGLSQISENTWLDASVFGPYTFSRDISIRSAWAGVGLGGEASAPVMANASVFVGGGVGAYLAYAAGSFSNSAMGDNNFLSLPAARVKDSDIRAGVKVSGETGIRVVNNDGSLTTLTFGATYRTAVAEADLPNKPLDPPARIGWADQIAYTAGLRMSFRTQ